MTERRGTKRKTKIPPQWVGFTIIVSITFMLALAINFRAYTAMSRESAQRDSLNKQIENLTSENLVLQDEIHVIKSDPKAIEREAKKIGLSRTEEKVPLPAN